MKMSFVDYKVDGHVGYITINREEKFNALSSAVLQDISDILDNVDQDTIRCLVITGAGKKAFVAGADIGQMESDKTGSTADFGLFGSNLFLRIERFPIPVVAAVNGYALGGGCELAMACDIRIASDNAKFGLPETGLGIIPSFGGTQRLPRIVGPSIAKEMMFTAKRIDAEEALKIGLVNAVYPQDELMAKAGDLASKIASNAPMAVRAAKEAATFGIEMPIEEGLALELKCVKPCFGSADQKNAMRAFVEKRKPDPFINR